MTDSPLDTFLASAYVAPEVFALRPDYRGMLVAVDGITPGPSDATSDALLRAAEESATRALAKNAVTELPHVAAWRDAYTAFGAKPGRTRNSLEALMRRATGGLPRVNRLTDVYNAISVAQASVRPPSSSARPPGRTSSVWSARGRRSTWRTRPARTSSHPERSRQPRAREELQHARSPLGPLRQGAP